MRIYSASINLQDNRPNVHRADASLERVLEIVDYWTDLYPQARVSLRAVGLTTARLA